MLTLPSKGWKLFLDTYAEVLRHFGQSYKFFFSVQFLFRVPHIQVEEQELPNTPLEHRDPEEVIEELLNLDDFGHSRMWGTLRWYANRLDCEPTDLYQDSILRILGGSRNCPKDTESLPFFLGVVKSITSEIYEKNKHREEQDKLVPLDETFWGNQNPLTPDKVLMMRRGESENLPDGFLESLILEARQNNDSEVEQYLIHSIAYGLKHEEIVQLSNWSPREAQTIQRRASRLSNRNIEQFKAKQKGE